MTASDDKDITVSTIFEDSESPPGSHVVRVFEDTDSDISSTDNLADSWYVEHVAVVANPTSGSNSSTNSLDDVAIGTADQEKTQKQQAFASSQQSSSSSEHISLIEAADFSLQSSGSPTSTSFRQSIRARPSAFAAIKPVVLSPDGCAPSLNSDSIDVKEDEQHDDDLGPSFREFALLGWNTNKLALLQDDVVFCDEGPRMMDPFCLENVDFCDVFPHEQTSESINAKALSKFCFPNGLRVRIVPAAAMPGALRNGWAGVGADRRHILVFTNGSGKTQHGVAITIRQDVPLTIQQKQELSRIVRYRHERRRAASRIARWWKRSRQTLLLKQALKLSGLKSYSVEELRSELSSSELQLLLQELELDFNKNRKKKSSGEKGSGLKPSSLRKFTSSSQRRRAAPPSPGSLLVASEHNTVESITIGAIQRSMNTTAEQQQGESRSHASSEVTDDTGLTETSTIDGSEKKRNLLSRLTERKSSGTKAIATPPTSPRPTRSPPKVVVSEWAREKGMESFEAMKHDAKYGYACIVEQCYVLLGCRPDEHVLLLGPLQQLVDVERKQVSKCRERARGSSIDTWVNDEQRIVAEQGQRRHVALKAMLDTLRLTRAQSLIVFPRNHLEYLLGNKPYFQAKLSIPHAEKIKLPLPLPSIGKQWALAKLILDIGPDSLVLILKLLLLERSILVLGENLEEVTPCVCGLLELLEPFEWSSVFLPVLPHSMLDFVTSPVPFVAGMAVRDYDRVCQVEKDKRTLEAMSTGMSLLNLSTKTLHITNEASISQMLSLDPYLREQLQSIRGRLRHFAQDPYSTIHSFQRFFRVGFSPKESVALDSACAALEKYFSRYCGDLATNCTAWKQYGTIDVKTGKFLFHPDWFLNNLKADQSFQEAMVHTQLFTGYVDERRKDQMEVEEMKRGEVGTFIAEWIYERWLLWKEQHSPVEV